MQIFSIGNAGSVTQTGKTNPAGAKGFEQGEIINATVIAVNAESVSLKLESGAVIQASVAGGVELIEGEALALLVDSRGGDKVVLKVVEQREGASETQQSDPLAAKLARLLARSGIRVSDEMINRVISVLKQHEGLPVEKALFLAANGIPADQAHLELLDSLSAGPGLAQELEGVMAEVEYIIERGEALPSVPDDSAIEEPKQTAAEVLERLIAKDPALETFLRTPQMYAKLEQGAKLALEQNSLQPLLNVLQEAGEAAPELKAALDVMTKAFAQEFAAQVQAQTGQDQPVPNVQAQTSEPGVPGQVQPAVLQPEQTVQTAQPVQTEAAANPAEQAAPQNVPDGQGVQEWVTTDQLHTKPSGHNWSVGEPAAQAARRGAPDGAQAQIQTLDEKIADADPQALLKKLGDFFANVAEREQGATLKRAASSQRERLESVRESLALMQPGERGTLTKLDQLISQTRFASEISRFAYIQLPVTIGDSNHTADIYVMKRDPQKKPNPEDTTMAVALDTERMGKVETLIKVEKRTVALRFRLESEELVTYFKNQSVELYNAMDEIGYKLLDVKCIKTDEPITPVTVEAVVYSEFTPKQLLDVRA